MPYVHRSLRTEVCRSEPGDVRCATPSETVSLPQPPLRPAASPSYRAQSARCPTPRLLLAPLFRRNAHPQDAHSWRSTHPPWCRSARQVHSLKIRSHTPDNGWECIATYVRRSQPLTCLWRAIRDQNFQNVSNPWVFYACGELPITECSGTSFAEQQVALGIEGPAFTKSAQRRPRAVISGPRSIKIGAKPSRTSLHAAKRPAGPPPTMTGRPGISGRSSENTSGMRAGPDRRNFCLCRPCSASFRVAVKVSAPGHRHTRDRARHAHQATCAKYVHARRAVRAVGPQGGLDLSPRVQAVREDLGRRASWGESVPVDPILNILTSFTRPLQSPRKDLSEGASPRSAHGFTSAPRRRRQSMPDRFGNPQGLQSLDPDRVDAPSFDTNTSYWHRGRLRRSSATRCWSTPSCSTTLGKMG